MSVNLHIIKPSVNNMCVRVLIRAAKLDITEVDAYGKTRTPEFLAMCPAHLTPFLEDSSLPGGCLLYTSPSPRDTTRSRMPSSA